MSFVARYFDAAAGSDERKNYSSDFYLFAAVAYFFNKQYGSTTVMLNEYQELIDEDLESKELLFKILSFVLSRKLKFNIKNESHPLLRSVFQFYKTGKGEKELRTILNAYRENFLKSNDSDTIIFGDFVIACVLFCLENTAWKLLPKYSDTGIAVWNEYLSSREAPRILWPAQILLGEKNILRGENGIVQLPTGVGKTKGIELIIRSTALSERGNTILIIAPLRALCNEITIDMRKAFGNNADINQLSDVLQWDFDFGELDKEADEKLNIIVCTPEKITYVIHHQPEIIDDIDLFVFDEGHMFDAGERGVTYELLIAEVKEHISEEQQMVLLSAVLSNSEEIAEWIFGDISFVPARRHRCRI